MLRGAATATATATATASPPVLLLTGIAPRLVGREAGLLRPSAALVELQRGGSGVGLEGKGKGICGLVRSTLEGVVATGGAVLLSPPAGVLLLQEQVVKSITPIGVVATTAHLVLILVLMLHTAPAPALGGLITDNITNRTCGKEQSRAMSLSGSSCSCVCACVCGSVMA